MGGVDFLYNFILWLIRGSLKPVLLLFCSITIAEIVFTRILEPEITHHRSKLVIIAAAR
jgi:hypothetical protein